MIRNQELFGVYQQHFFSSSNEFKCISTTKLPTTLFDKEKYVLYQRNLKQFIEAGLQLKRYIGHESLVKVIRQVTILSII